MGSQHQLQQEEEGGRVNPHAGDPDSVSSRPQWRLRGRTVVWSVLEYRQSSTSISNRLMTFAGANANRSAMTFAGGGLC